MLSTCHLIKTTQSLTILLEKWWIPLSNLAYQLSLMPTFVTINRKEVLDITLATQLFTPRVKHWHVSNEETLSDHKEINFSIACDVLPETLFRNPRNTDWPIFTRNLTSKLRNSSSLGALNTHDEVDTAVNRLIKAIQSAFVSACPGRITKPKLNNWWNNELEKLKRETRKLNHI